MQTTGIITGLDIDYKTQKPKISLVLDTDELDVVEQLKTENKLNIELKKWYKKRSLDANAYFHVLVNELARHLNISDRKMKIALNLRYGTIARDDNGTAIGIKIPKGTDITQFYDYAKWFGECEDNGIKFDKYLFYKQTHTLNTKEMSELINGVVQECQDNGLETRPKSEIDSMLESWNKTMIVTDLSKEFNPVPKTKEEKKKDVKRIKQKTNKLAKRERKRTSILQEEDGKCFICRKKLKLDKHEAFGGSNRQKSMQWKMIYYLCRNCHSKADLDKNTRTYLHNFARAKFIKEYSEEQFLKEFGKNYLDIRD